MKKVKLNKLNLKKEQISNLNLQRIKGGQCLSSFRTTCTYGCGGPVNGCGIPADPDPPTEL